MGAAIAEAVLARGGFSLAARIAFVALACLAAAVACVAGGRAAAARAALHPFVLVLAALALLGALSSLWTTSFADDALEWALLPAGYAALAAAVVATADAAPTRTVLLASLGACSFLSGLVGLVGAATFSEPQAFRPVGSWRPAGTIEYAPGLALLMVCALPALLRALCSEGRGAWVVASPLLVAGAVLGLGHSRLEVALALAVAGCCVASPGRTLRAPRADAVAAFALVVLAGVAARATLGGAVPVGAEQQGWRLAVVIAACALAPAGWLVVRRVARRTPPLVLALALAALIAAGTIHGFAGSAAPAQPTTVGVHHRARPVRNDLLHGRAAIWDASLRAFERRPLMGAGAGAFLTATEELQRPPLTSYAHDLPLEFGVELGTPGLLLAVALYLLVARACWRSRLGRDAWLLAVPALAFIVANLVDWPWHIAGLGAPWAAATAALAAGASRGGFSRAARPAR